MTAVLTCEDLTVTYPDGVTPVNGISFAVEPGECFALVGGSGAGKTTVAKALMGLHGHGTRVSGKLFLGTKEMSGAPAEVWRNVRGHRLGFVAQNPWSACDPLRPVRDHVAEAWRCHGLAVSWQEIGARLTALGVTDATMRMMQHPHAWSGGMLQRAGITAAGALTPPLMIADEPTSALDKDRAQSVLDSLRDLGCAILLISHEIGLVLKNADKVGVLHGGQIVEQGPPDTLKSASHHPQSKRLLAALDPLPKRKQALCKEPLLRLQNVSVNYDRGRVQALDNANLDIRSGEIVGVQGPSGCGKSTLLRIVMGIERPSAGTVWRAGDLGRAGAILPIFQDPVAGLVPHWPIWRSIAEPLSAPHRHRLRTAELKDQALSAMALVGLQNVDPDARPSELSVGQCQRVSIARATITRPPLIVADEPTSALDSPSTWMVGNLLQSAAETGSAVLVVSHDNTFLEDIADRIVYMKAGRTLKNSQ